MDIIRVVLVLLLFSGQWFLFSINTRLRSPGLKKPFFGQKPAKIKKHTIRSAQDKLLIA